MNDFRKNTECKKCVFYRRNGFCYKKRIWLGEDTLTLCTEFEEL